MPIAAEKTEITEYQFLKKMKPDKILIPKQKKNLKNLRV